MHFQENETEAQAGANTCPRTHSELVAVKTRNQALEPPPPAPTAFPTPPPPYGCLDSLGLHPGIPLPQNTPFA